MNEKFMIFSMHKHVRDGFVEESDEVVSPNLLKQRTTQSCWLARLCNSGIKRSFHRTFIEFLTRYHRYEI